MKYIKCYFKKNKGFALPMVLLIMVVLMILFISVSFIADANSKQVATQEDNLRAYYLARSGIDIAYAALMEEKDGVPKIMKFIDDTKVKELTDELYLPNDSNLVGIVNINVSKVDNEVRIQAIAKTSKGNGSSKLSLYIDKNDITRTRWVKE